MGRLKPAHVDARGGRLQPARILSYLAWPLSAAMSAALRRVITPI
jgi:hypothetical protein